jgi:hypothetical protein
MMRAVERFGVDPRHDELCVGVSRADGAADALMALMRATFASGRLEVSPCPGALRFRFGFRGEVLELHETEQAARAVAQHGWLADGALAEPALRPAATSGARLA